MTVAEFAPALSQFTQTLHSFGADISDTSDQMANVITADYIKGGSIVLDPDMVKTSLIDIPDVLPSYLNYRGVYNNPADCETPKLGDCITSNGHELVYDGSTWVDMTITARNDLYTLQDCTMVTGITNYQDVINELTEKINALSKKAIPRFNCIYCGTQNFEYNGVATTPQCPNCGALMRRVDESILADTKALYCEYPPF